MDKPRMIEIINKTVNHTVFDCKWIPCSAKFLTIGSQPKGTGILEIFELNESEVTLVKKIEKKTGFKCCTFGASSLRNRHLAIGDFSGRLQIIDIERHDIPLFTVEAHDGLINAVDGIGGKQINCGAPEILTGGRDGSVKVWDPRQGKEPVVDISPEIDEVSGDGKPQGRRDCWTACFGNSYNNQERYVCAGYDNGDVKLFDLRSLSVMWETTLRNGVCCVEFDRNDIPMNKLVVGTLEGGLYCFDMRTLHPDKGFAQCSERNAGRSVGTNGVITGPKSTVWSVRHCPQNRDIFVSSGGSGSLRLWKYQYPDQRKKDDGNGCFMGVAGSMEMLHATTLSSQPVHCFDWSPDKLGLGLAGSFDETVRVIITNKLNLY